MANMGIYKPLMLWPPPPYQKSDFGVHETVKNESSDPLPSSGNKRSSKINHSSVKNESRYTDQDPGNLCMSWIKSTDPGNHYKMPLNIVPSPWSFSSLPCKRAVLCGVTYNEKKHRLKGTINAVKNMRDMLIATFKYQDSGERNYRAYRWPFIVPKSQKSTLLGGGRLVNGFDSD